MPESKEPKSQWYWEDLAGKCETAYSMAPKWSPMRYLFKWYAGVARRNAAKADCEN
mgnify:FL=1|jgi:hypothetical protein